eukprot:1845043-Pyramimonas_sp.AAC.1
MTATELALTELIQIQQSRSSVESRAELRLLPDLESRNYRIVRVILRDDVGLVITGIHLKTSGASSVAFRGLNTKRYRARMKIIQKHRGRERSAFRE